MTGRLGESETMRIAREQDFDGHLGRRFPVSIYDPISTQLSENDQISILTLQAALRQRGDEYAYLEIGSFRGGSLQPFLLDETCSTVYSIDPRTGVTKDTRPRRIAYSENSTDGMVRELRRVYGDRVLKLRCFESDASQVVMSDLTARPSFCFIDGEHTDAAFERDFLSCLRLAAHSAVIAADDGDLIFRGLRNALQKLDQVGRRWRAYMLPDTIAVVEIGDLDLYRNTLVRDHLASIDTAMYLMDELGRYRDFLWSVGRLPGAVTFRRLASRFPFGKALRLR
jgi:hypothetical protein